MADMKSITPDQLHAWSENPPQLLDVRGDGEVRRGAIPGMIHIPMHLIPVRYGELDRERPVVVYCASGARSAQVARYLLQQGFEEVYNLSGGIQAWSRQFSVATGG